MYLQITRKLTVGDVQKAFSSAFPFLKIEFLNRSAGSYPDAGSTPADENLEITGEMKVWQLEQALDKWYPFDARIFRRSGKIWLETTMTNDWTLERQNEHGREISLSVSRGGRAANRCDPTEIKDQ
ncbi:MAG: hypothetical protein M9933_10535 [Chitinophagaceae bacterium]|nr:hypothetical protein [Chitinophagaceae bacterium]